MRVGSRRKDTHAVCSLFEKNKKSRETTSGSSDRDWPYRSSKRHFAEKNACQSPLLHTAVLLSPWASSSCNLL